MRVGLLWSDNIADKDGVPQVIQDLAISPDGTQFVAGAGSRVLVYDLTKGMLVESLKGHKNLVQTVDYARDGKHFATGSADKSVIVWAPNLEGVVRFSHTDAVQAVRFNPVSPQMLLTVGTNDFGVWSPGIKTVSKTKVNTRIVSAGWTNDGQFIGLGLSNGLVSVRTRNGDERNKIETRLETPAFSLAWNPVLEDVLVVGDWMGNVGFFQSNGSRLAPPKQLPFGVTSVDFSASGEYMLLGGADHKAHLMTKDGIHLSNIGENFGEWVTCARLCPDQNVAIVGGNGGTIGVYSLTYATVHGLYAERYAFRDGMTDVVVQQLLTDERTRIKCKDLVRKIAIYKERLAVQLTDRVMVYEQVKDPSDAPSAVVGATDLQYRLVTKIMRDLPCSLLVVTGDHLLLCLERRLQLIRSTSGETEREWSMESPIRYIKVIGGPSGHEGLLVGMKNGNVVKIFVDNALAIPLVTGRHSVRCLDLSIGRNKLAVVDDTGTCSVYDMRTRALLFSEPHASSVAWNTQNDDLLCFSGNGMLTIKAASFPAHKQKLNGFVVGFNGSRIYCLHQFNMNAIDVPQGASLAQYLERKQFDGAYRIACLGVTDRDWRLLGVQALEALEFEIARKSFIRLRDFRFLNLLFTLEQQRARGGAQYSRTLLQADVAAYLGRYGEAAQLFVNAGRSERAVEMYTDLRMFEEARAVALMKPTGSVDAEGSATQKGKDTMQEESKGSVDAVVREEQMKQLARKEADWAAESDPWSAASMYMDAGESVQAVQVLVDARMAARVVELCRSRVNMADKPALTIAAKYLAENDQVEQALELYKRMNDHESLCGLLTRTRQWEAAFEVVREHAEMKEAVYLPYAEWLQENDRFDEAQKAFRDAGRATLAVRMLERLAQMAVEQRRFDDAAYFYHMLSGAQGSVVDAASAQGTTEGARESRARARVRRLSTLAEVYYAYHFVQRYMEEPFSRLQSSTLFNMARYLLHQLYATGAGGDSAADAAPGVSRVNVLYALGKKAREESAFKLARHAFDKLQALRAPAKWATEISVAALSVRAKPLTDREDLLPLCYRCMTVNALVNMAGAHCAVCLQPFVFSFQSFDVLPLVEFALAPGVSDDEAQRLIQSAAVRPFGQASSSSGKGAKWRESTSPSGAQSLVLGDGAGDEMEEENEKGDGGGDERVADPFDAKHWALATERQTHFQAVQCTRAHLKRLSRADVFIVRAGTGASAESAPVRYFRNMMPDSTHIRQCASCQRFFYSDEFELAALQHKGCPFCRCDRIAMLFPS